MRMSLAINKSERSAVLAAVYGKRQLAYEAIMTGPGPYRDYKVAAAAFLAMDRTDPGWLDAGREVAKLQVAALAIAEAHDPAKIKAAFKKRRKKYLGNRKRNRKKAERRTEWLCDYDTVSRITDGAAERVKLLQTNRKIDKEFGTDMATLWNAQNVDPKATRKFIATKDERIIPKDEFGAWMFSGALAKTKEGNVIMIIDCQPEKRKCEIMVEGIKMIVSKKSLRPVDEE